MRVYTAQHKVLCIYSDKRYMYWFPLVFLYRKETFVLVCIGEYAFTKKGSCGQPNTHLIALEVERNPTRRCGTERDFLTHAVHCFVGMDYCAWFARRTRDCASAWMAVVLRMVASRIPFCLLLLVLVVTAVSGANVGEFYPVCLTCVTTMTACRSLGLRDSHTQHVQWLHWQWYKLHFYY